MEAAAAPSMAPTLPRAPFDAPTQPLRIGVALKQRLHRVDSASPPGVAQSRRGACIERHFQNRRRQGWRRRSPHGWVHGVFESASRCSRRGGDPLRSGPPAARLVVGDGLAEVDAERAELAIEVRALHADPLGELADFATAEQELLLQIGSLEMLACFAQRHG